jgi:hypothetical protein
MEEKFRFLSFSVFQHLGNILSISHAKNAWLVALPIYSVCGMLIYNVLVA